MPSRSRRKFVSADHTARVSEHGIAVGEGLPTEQIAKIQAEIDSLAQKMTDLDDQVGNAKDYRRAVLKRFAAKSKRIPPKLRRNLLPCKRN